MDQNQMQAMMMQQQMQQIEQHLESLNLQIEELTLLSENIKSLKEDNKEREAFMPLSGGIYLPGIIPKMDKILVNVGSGVMLKKTIPETEVIIKNQINQLKEAKVRLETEMSKFSSQGLKA